jgi:hypothetical protein
MEVDTCIYIKKQGEQRVFIAIYVDDCMIITPHDLLQMTKNMLSSGKFKVKDLGDAKSLLGYEILHNR